MKLKTIFCLFLLVLLTPLIHSVQAQTTDANQSSHQDLVSINTPEPETPPENFDDPKLPEGTLKQTVALMLERADYPTYSRELWRVQWRTGDPIDLYIIKPQAVAKPPVVIYLYGFPSDTTRFTNDAYCKSVTSHGIAAVGFVSALTGPRFHDRGWKEWFVGDLPEGLGTSAHDVQMILNFLEKRTDLDTKKAGMFGQGSGATIAVLAAASDPRIRAVDLLDPWGDWSQWLKQSPVIADDERAPFLVDSFQAQLKDLDPIKWLPRLVPDSVRLQQTSFNAETPQNIQQALADRMPPNSSIVRYKTVDDYKSRAAEGAAILDWISNRLHQQ